MPSRVRACLSLAFVLVLAPGALRGQGVQGAPDALDRLNAAFRDTYRSAKARQVARTVIVLNGDQALLLRGNATAAEAEVRPYLYHRLKSVDHVALALYLELLAMDEGSLTGPARERWAGLRALAAQARAGLGAPFAPGPVLERQQLILDRSLAVMDGLLKAGRGSRAQAAAFAAELSAPLMANVADGAALQLEALHRVVTQWRKAMPASEWDALKVVLIGAHMPREGEVNFQYFSRLLGQPKEGDRIIYAEGLWDVKDALDLLATHGVDRGLGEAFFGDPERMHRDLLADAAKAWLARTFR